MDDEDDTPTMEDTMAEAYDRATADEPSASVEAPDADADAAPAHWPEADRGVFARLDGDGRKFLLRRHREMEADYTRKMQALAEHRRTSEAFAEATRPFAAMIAAEGASPMDALRSLLGTAHALRTGTPAEKARQLGLIAQRYGIPLGHAAPQFARPPAPQQHAAHAAVQAQHGARMAEAARFREALGPDGQLLHPDFDRLAPDIGALLTTGRATSLADAYDRASWAHPHTRRRHLAAAEQERTRAATQRADAARRSVNVRGVAAAPRATRGKTIEDTMAMVYDRIHGKEAD